MSEKKKMGFASMSLEKRLAAASKGGKKHVAKGFAKMDAEKRREISKLAGRKPKGLLKKSPPIDENVDEGVRN